MVRREKVSHGLPVSGACWIMLMAVLWSSCSAELPALVAQDSGGGACFLSNAYTVWSDRSVCKVRMVGSSVGSKDEDLKAAKVSLGVLGVMSTVTLQLRRGFKRSVTLNLTSKDAGMEDEILQSCGWRRAKISPTIITWYPSLAKVVCRYDHRVPANAVGGDMNLFFANYR